MRRDLFASLLLMCLAPLAPAYAIAQTSNAALGGTVADPSGALIPGVSITAVNTQTGIVSTTVSKVFFMV